MKTLSAFGASVIAISAIALLPGRAASQQKSLSEQLVGTWTLISVSVERKDGTKFDPWGVGAKGISIFTSDGHFATINTRSDRPKFMSNNRLQGTAEEYKATAQGVLAEFGTYTLDELHRAITTHVDASSFPNDNDAKKRYLITSLTRDELTYSVSNSTIGGAAIQVTMKRAR